MALRIELKPFERLIINGAAIRNGDKRADLKLETQCRFLRESEIIYESEVDTPCKQLWLTVQVLYLSNARDDVERLFFEQANAVLAKMPSAAPYLNAVREELDAERFFQAIKAVKRLVEFEASLIAAAQALPERAAEAG